MLQLGRVFATTAKSGRAVAVSRYLTTSHWAPAEASTLSATTTSAPPLPEVVASSTSSPVATGRTKSRTNRVARRDLRFIFPEFLPDPDPYFRNRLVEKLQRRDMLKRRQIVELPEFYVGSVIAVTVADRNAQTPDRTSRFLGICIARGGSGTRAWIIVRNVIDNQGVEFLYDLYAPTVLKVETLRLEKRLDDEMLYLRDAPLKYSTFPFDMDPEVLPDGQPVPINEVRVPLNPAPWVQNWARFSDRLMGYTFDYRTMNYTKQKTYEVWATYRSSGWMMQLLKYDLLLQYMETIPLEEQDEIWEEVADTLIERDQAMKKVAAQRSFTRPVERK